MQLGNQEIITLMEVVNIYIMVHYIFLVMLIRRICHKLENIFCIIFKKTTCVKVVYTYICCLFYLVTFLLKIHRHSTRLLFIQFSNLLVHYPIYPLAHIQYRRTMGSYDTSLVRTLLDDIFQNLSFCGNI